MKALAYQYGQGALVELQGQQGPIVLRIRPASQVEYAFHCCPLSWAVEVIRPEGKGRRPRIVRVGETIKIQVGQDPIWINSGVDAGGEEPWITATVWATDGYALDGVGLAWDYDTLRVHAIPVHAVP